jgi:hypothetical protein
MLINSNFNKNTYTFNKINNSNIYKIICSSFSTKINNYRHDINKKKINNFFNQSQKQIQINNFNFDIYNNMEMLIYKNYYVNNSSYNIKNSYLHYYSFYSLKELNSYINIKKTNNNIIYDYSLNKIKSNINYNFFYFYQQIINASQKVFSIEKNQNFFDFYSKIRNTYTIFFQDSFVFYTKRFHFAKNIFTYILKNIYINKKEFNIFYKYSYVFNEISNKNIDYNNIYVRPRSFVYRRLYNNIFTKNINTSIVKVNNKFTKNISIKNNNIYIPFNF